jgi:uncharacterized membrane protein (DUF485 family)
LPFAVLHVTPGRRERSSVLAYALAPEIEVPMNEKQQALEALAAAQWRLALRLTAAMMAVYFGFILLVAWRKPLLAHQIVPGLSLGILLGALVIVSAWVLIRVYVRWANSHYDATVARIRGTGR